ncbi:DUF4007 family protein [Geodermatophilus nigrescens]|uniref:DUF4007 domain-containing protein n=1 Tax=Geodermatophilus nigrescens TaxID=1070870 RepID=A0A1M5M9C3_9ACTN|nr:DUF4007 family protein [Geodermatophilus nigrescens]SHG73887.1 Protein of unknown function [Geodermatophilus nigrescens]
MSGTLLDAAARPVFARHETFPLRFGWLRKAYTETQRDPMVFTQADATVQLGVGKNMVNAIRYWAQAYKVLEEQHNPQRPRVPQLVPTAFGRRLLDDEYGWDPWLETPASLWLLHWQLLAPPSLAPAWWVAFHLFAPQQFEETQLIEHVIELSAAAGWRTVMESSIKKDVDCLLRTFALRRQGRQTMDDLLDCPARELGLIELAAGESRSWRFVLGAKPSLPAAVVGYACLDYLATRSPGEQSISLARLTSDPGSPGLAFRLPESVLHEALLQLAATEPGLHIIEPAGLRQLVIDAPVSDLAESLLDRHYSRAQS